MLTAWKDRAAFSSFYVLFTSASLKKAPRYDKVFIVRYYLRKGAFHEKATNRAVRSASVLSAGGAFPHGLREVRAGADSRPSAHSHRRLPAGADAAPRQAIVAELDEVRALMNGGQSYAAFQRLVALEDQYRGEPEHLKACEALFDELDTLLQAAEPASGTEYHRNFPVQGGCVLEVSAFSGPVLVTVTDEFAVLDQKPNPGTVSLYVRQGEQAETHLPAGTYRIRYQVGYRWFGEEIGFGEYCTEGELEPLEFDFYMNGDWASNAKFKITF